MSDDASKRLPGAEIVLPGLEDLAAGRASVNASAVQAAATRLRRTGMVVPLSKLKRGLDLDLHDVRNMVDSGQVEPAKLRELFELNYRDWPGIGQPLPSGSRCRRYAPLPCRHGIS